MKKVIGVIVVICILMAVIDSDKEGSSSVGTMQDDFEYNSGSEGTAVTVPGYREDYFMEENFMEEKYPCYLCDGNGVVRCRVCDGSGENPIYDSLTSTVLKAFERPYCEACDGKGVITCGRCHGSGMD